jgi:peptidylprolyl isomerase
MNAKTLTSGLAAATVAALLAGCGGSTASGVALAPGGGPTSDTVTTATTATATTTTSADTVKVPSTGALSKEPVFSVPTGAAPTKLQTKDMIVGTGATAKTGDKVWVSYVGKVYKTGKVFDASWKDEPGAAVEFTLSKTSVIPGWVDGLQGMRVGGRRELIIPPSLGYGDQEESGIPKNSTLVFVVDLIKVQK